MGAVRLGPALRHAALRDRADRRRTASVCVLELELEGALTVQDDVAGQRDDLHRRRRRRARAAAPRARDREHGRDRRAHRARARRSSSRRIASGTWCETTTSSARPPRWRRSSSASSRSQVPWRGHDPSTNRRSARPGRRLPLRARARRRQARPADQQLPPPARRGHRLRGGPAAADRVPLEELPHDGDGRDREREDHATRTRRAERGRVARILLGVTGGIAAYKACTLVRLLVRAGHDVHPVVTAGRRALRHRRDVPRARAPDAERRSVPASRALSTSSSSRR